MQSTKLICDCCGNDIEGEESEFNLSACLAHDTKESMEEREIDLEDLCVSCANALYEAIKPILLRRQEL
jgi:hypothetical protein